MENSKQTAISASIYTDNLDVVETILKKNLEISSFTRIEQGTVLVYEDVIHEVSVEYYNNSFYMSGRIKKELTSASSLILKIADSFKELEIKFSIDYQEENSNGESTSVEFNISSNDNLQ